MTEPRDTPPGPEELRRLQEAEERKSDPALDDVEAARIDVAEPAREEPFERLQAQARRMSPERARAAVEALLFLADKPLGVEEARQATGLESQRIRRALEDLQGHYRQGVSGMVLHEVAGGWQLRTSPDVAGYARQFLRVKPQRLTRAALETMAIVAYRQPVTRPEIEEIRGVDSGAVLKALLERRLLKILGKKEEPGRPILYGTTREFLEFFSLKDLASLPTLREFQELSEEHRDIVEKEAGPDEAGVEGLVAELSDPSLRESLEGARAQGDAALEALEEAVGRAEASSRAAEAALRAARPPSEEAPAEGGPTGAPPGEGKPPGA